MQSILVTYRASGGEEWGLGLATIKIWDSMYWGAPVAGDLTTGEAPVAAAAVACSTAAGSCGTNTGGQLHPALTTASSACAHHERLW